MKIALRVAGDWENVTIKEDILAQLVSQGELWELPGHADLAIPLYEGLRWPLAPVGIDYERNAVAK